MDLRDGPRRGFACHLGSFGVKCWFSHAEGLRAGAVFIGGGTGRIGVKGAF